MLWYTYFKSIPYYFLIFIFYNTFTEIKLLKYYLDQIVEKETKSLLLTRVILQSHIRQRSSNS